MPALWICEGSRSPAARPVYYVDAKRAIMRPAGFAALGRAGGRAAAGTVATAGRRHDECEDRSPRRARGGGGREASSCARRDKRNGAHARIDGTAPGAGDRCWRPRTSHHRRVDPAPTRRCADARPEIAACVRAVDRLAGGGEAIAEDAARAYVALTTIDDCLPRPPDRSARPERVTRGNRRRMT